MKSEIPTDLINETTLTTKLNDYYTIGQIEEKLVDEDELAYELNDYTTKDELIEYNEIDFVPYS